MTENTKYHPLLQALHWLMALGLIVAFAMGVYMSDIPGISPLKLKLMNWHKWLGVSLALLLGVRLLVKLMSRKPLYPKHWSNQQRLAAHAGHAVLYVGMLLVPILGYCYSLAAGFPVVLFGIWPLPVLLAPDPELKVLLKTLHEWCAKGLGILVLGHIGMVLWHQRKPIDAVLHRMLPKFVIAIVLCFAFSPDMSNANAIEVKTIVAKQSRIELTFKQMGVPITAQFTQVTGEVQFDPSTLKQTKARVLVPTASFDVGDALMNKELAKPDWLHSKQFPEAVFELGELTRQGDNKAQSKGSKWLAKGHLTIRGIRRPIVVSVTLQSTAQFDVWSTQFNINRLDYQIGATGDWRDTSLVANEVLLNVKLTTAKPTSNQGQ